MQNCQSTLLVFSDRKVKLVDLFKTMELLNNSYAFYMLGRGSAPPQTLPLSVNAFCIVTNSAHETLVYPKETVSRGPSVGICLWLASHVIYRGIAAKLGLLSPRYHLPSWCTETQSNCEAIGTERDLPHIDSSDTEAKQSLWNVTNLVWGCAHTSTNEFIQKHSYGLYECIRISYDLNNYTNTHTRCIPGVAIPGSNDWNRWSQTVPARHSRGLPFPGSAIPAVHHVHRLFRSKFCRLGLREGFLYRLGFRSRVSSAHFCIF